MVYNGIEYSMMQGCAEEFEFMSKSDNNFAALFPRFRSQQEESFAEKMLAALRNAFGGHAVKR